MLELLKQPAVIGACISAFVSGTVSNYLFIQGHNSAIARERLEKVYFPIFKELRDYFFNYSPDDTFFLIAVTNVQKIIEDNELIAGNKLYDLFEMFSKCQDNASFEALCNYILNEYNRLLRASGLPPMSPFYRINHKMYDRLGVAIFFIKYIFTSVFMFCIGCILIFISLFFFIESPESSGLPIATVSIFLLFYFFLYPRFSK